MRKIAQAILAVALLTALISRLNAVVIEGTTPTGQFKTVGLDSSGRFQVAIGSTSLGHVIVDSGTVTANQGGAWTVGVTQSGPFTFTATTSGNFTVQTATASHVAQGQINVTGGASAILTANVDTRQSVVCNTSLTNTVWLGDAGVSTSNGLPLTAGSCFGPDVPNSFVGTLYAVSTAATTVAWLSVRAP